MAIILAGVECFVYVTRIQGKVLVLWIDAMSALRQEVSLVGVQNFREWAEGNKHNGIFTDDDEVVEF